MGFTWLFLVEMALKLIGMGIDGYTKDSMNLLDGFVCMISIIEIFMNTMNDSESNNPLIDALKNFRIIRVLRTLRTLRINRLLRSLSYLFYILDVISRTIG